jgi:hypothetical protein
MTEELTPGGIILLHKEDLIIIAQELLSEGLSSENLDTYNDLIWWIKSIENIEARASRGNMAQITTLKHIVRGSQLGHITITWVI